MKFDVKSHAAGRDAQAHFEPGLPFSPLFWAPPAALAARIVALAP
jgi:hypothetical protein